MNTDSTVSKLLIFSIGYLSVQAILMIICWTLSNTADTTFSHTLIVITVIVLIASPVVGRSEKRRVGKECA